MYAFTCPRSCPLHAELRCRFGPIFARLGPTTVDSHTTRVKVEYRDPDTLRRAVEALGGTWLGQGTHRLFEGNVSGYGFKLPGWNYPCVLEGSGAKLGEQLHYDTYNGSWGNEADLQRLQDRYAVETASAAALSLGWSHEVNADGQLIVYHPQGGTLTVSPGGVCETQGFEGRSCHEAREQLGLRPVEGTMVETAEACQTAARVQLPTL